MNCFAKRWWSISYKIYFFFVEQPSLFDSTQFALNMRSYRIEKN